MDKQPIEYLDINGPNPFGLKLLACVPDSMTKVELAKRVLPADLQFDYSLPQEWLNKQCQKPDGECDIDKYDRIVSRCVWAYPRGSYFGVCLDLESGEAWV